MRKTFGKVHSFGYYLGDSLRQFRQQLGNLGLDRLSDLLALLWREPLTARVKYLSLSILFPSV